MTAPRPDAEILDEMMLVVQTGGMQTARTEELKIPLLLARTEDGIYHPFALAPTGLGLHPGEMAKMLLCHLRATHMALCLEAWCYETEVSPEDKQRLLAGDRPITRVAPRDHPERFDILSVIGETRGQPQIMRSWIITQEPGATERTFTPRREGGQALPARFTPLFVDHAAIHELIGEHLWREHLRDQTRGGRN